MMPDRRTLLKHLAAHDFALYETALYLDGHPDDQTALAYREKEQKIAEKLRRDYEELYGPLTIYSPIKGDRWNYICAPWPWEKEAN